jgi:hypothetical protein
MACYHSWAEGRSLTPRGEQNGSGVVSHDQHRYVSGKHPSIQSKKRGAINKLFLTEGVCHNYGVSYGTRDIMDVPGRDDSKARLTLTDSTKYLLSVTGPQTH